MSANDILGLTAIIISLIAIIISLGDRR